MKKVTFLIILLALEITSFGQSQMEMNQQAFRDYIKADAEMTVVYKKVLKKMTDSNQKQMLINAQRAWIKYKDAHCKAIANLYEGGSMQPMVYSGCLAELTKERTKNLQTYFENN